MPHLIAPPFGVASPLLATLGNRTFELRRIQAFRQTVSFWAAPRSTRAFRGAVCRICANQTNLFKFICSMLSTALPKANGAVSAERGGCLT